MRWRFVGAEASLPIFVGELVALKRLICGACDSANLFIVTFW